MTQRHRAAKHASTASPALAAGIVIAALAAFMLSTDVYVATMPRMAEAFAVEPSLIQLTVTLNLAAYALSTLVHGPLSDRFGRARVLCWGLGGFCAASALCWLAPNVEALIVGRIGQGLAASAGTVLAAVIIRELFDDTGAQRWLAIMALATAAGPAFGPLVGAALAEGFGWRGPFAALVAVSALVLLAACRLPETGQPRPDALVLRRVLARYAAVACNASFMRYQLINAFALAALFAFITAAPFVFIETFGLGPMIYATLHGSLVLVYIATTAINARLAGRVAPERLLSLGIWVGLAGVALLVLGAVWSGGSMWGIVLGMAFNAASIALLMGNGWLLMLNAVVPAEMGTASAFAGCMQMLLAALASLTVAALPAGSPVFMALAVGLYAGGAGLTYLLLRPRAPGRALAP